MVLIAMVIMTMLIAIMMVVMVTIFDDGIDDVICTR